MSSKPPVRPPNMSQEEYDAYLARKKADKKAAEDSKAQDKFDKTYAGEMKKRYGAKADPATVEEMIDAGELGDEWFKEGEWKPAWSNVEFVSSSRGMGTTLFRMGWARARQS
jgi:hypothetical protein